MDYTLECPNCEEPVIIPSQQTLDNSIINCPHCRIKLKINEDAEFINGRWVNLSSLYVHNPSKGS